MNDKSEIGIIVGRFQSSFLHEGHLEVINHVIQNHARVILFLGQSPRKCNFEDPLDFNSRRAMIEEKYPEIEVHRLDDVGDDVAWSKNLDRMIGLLIAPNQQVVLYGSRDSFIKSYTGKNLTAELKASKYISASDIRKTIGVKSKKTKEFREGVIWATQNDWPRVYPTVDIIAFDKSTNRILLGKKVGDKLWRIPGGFAETKSISYEEDASRELQEETGLIALVDPTYIGSEIIYDWRYKGRDKIKTLLFVTTSFDGVAKASDDLDIVQWFDVQDLYSNSNGLDNINPIHKSLITRFLTWYKKNIDSWAIVEYKNIDK